MPVSFRFYLIIHKDCEILINCGTGENQKILRKELRCKQIFRKVMQCYIPEQITNGIRQGFSTPDATRFKGESIEYVKKKLYNDYDQMYDCLD